jgi:hypothetical protein
MVKSKQFAIIWDELALTEFQEILEYLSGRSILAPAPPSFQTWWHK